MAQAPTFIVIAHYYFIYLLPESIYLYPLLRSILLLAFSFGSLFISSFNVAVFSFYLHVLIYLAQQHQRWIITRRSAVLPPVSLPQCATR